MRFIAPLSAELDCCLYWEGARASRDRLPSWPEVLDGHVGSSSLGIAGHWEYDVVYAVGIVGMATVVVAAGHSTFLDGHSSFALAGY